MAVLSKFPIIDHQVYKLPGGAEPRCALEISVNGGAKFGEINFVGIHNDWTQEKLRVAQSKALIERLEKRKGAVILAGDFNAGRESESIGLFLKSGFQILAEVKINTFPSNQPKVEIDFIMSRGIKYKRFYHSVVDQKIASDHRPVVVVLTP